MILSMDGCGTDVNAAQEMMGKYYEMSPADQAKFRHDLEARIDSQGNTSL